jgi:DNA-binding response OmpR family regulator
MPNQQHPPGIAILRDVTGRLALFINGQRSDRRGQGQLALLACLLDNLGRAIPYKRLFTVIGRKSDNEYSRHLLRQYMLVLREILLANKAPLVIATVHDVGYALCEIAEATACRVWRKPCDIGASRPG